MKKILFLFFFGFSFTLFSQRQYSKEFSFINDNDLYISTKQDRYYTNGTFLNYRYLSKNNSKNSIKKVYNLEFGQLIYSPYISVVKSVSLHDRPFAGYLYGRFGIENFYKNNNILKLSIETGILGPSSLAEETMEFVHNIYGIKKAVGWKYQIQETLGINLNGSYLKHLGSSSLKKIDITWHNNIKLGTIFTDITTGIYTRIALFKPLQSIDNSIAFGGNLNNKNSKYTNKPEAFFYIKPAISLVVYDATIQGSFFNTSSPITYSINPFKFTTQFGVRFTANRFNFGYSAVYHTKKLKSVRVPNGNFYGSIQINYQFN